jgi:hypothetical protein
MRFDGTWRVVIASPSGKQRVVLRTATRDGRVDGSASRRRRGERSRSWSQLLVHAAGAGEAARMTADAPRVHEGHLGGPRTGRTDRPRISSSPSGRAEQPRGAVKRLRDRYHAAAARLTRNDVIWARVRRIPRGPRRALGRGGAQGRRPLARWPPTARGPTRGARTRAARCPTLVLPSPGPGRSSRRAGRP